MKFYFTILIIYLTVISCINSFAGDTNLSAVTKAKTLSLNGLYFAGTDGIQSVLGNPSMLSYLNSGGIEVFVFDQFGQHKFENLQDEIYKSLNNDEFNFGGGIYWTFSQSFTAALSYQRSLDYKIDWPFLKFFSNDSTSSILGFIYSNELTIDAASASFAFKLNNFSVGGAAHLYYVENYVAFPRSNERWNDGLGLAAYQFNYNQDGYSYGFNLGASMQVDEKFRIGLMASSGFSTHLEGSASSIMFSQLDSASSIVKLSSTVEIPWIFGGGLFYDFTDYVKLNFDVQYNLWSGIQKTFDFSFNDQLWQQKLSMVDSLTGLKGSSFTLEFNNSLDIGVGMEYKIANVFLRTGYRFLQSPNSEASYNMIFPSVDRHRISIGISYQDNDFIFDAAVCYTIGVSKDVKRTAVQNTRGSYSSSMVTPAITIKYLL